MALALVLLANANAAYGLWFGVYAKEFASRAPFTGRVKYRYKPSTFQRVMVVAGSLIILTAGAAEIVRLWKSN